MVDGLLSQSQGCGFALVGGRRGIVGRQCRLVFGTVVVPDVPVVDFGIGNVFAVHAVRV